MDIAIAGGVLVAVALIGTAAVANPKESQPMKRITSIALAGVRALAPARRQPRKGCDKAIDTRRGRCTVRP